MRIGLVSPYDYSFPGGVVNHISYLARYFIQWGHDVRIIAPCLKKGTQYFDEEVTAVGRPFPVPASGSIARVPLSPWLPSQIEDILDKGKFDVLHLHEPFTPMLSLSALLKSDCVNVGTFHACHSKPRGYWLAKPIIQRWLPKLHGKIAVSKSALDFVSRHLPGDYQVIPNGIDIEYFSPDGARREEFVDDKLNILFVGRLERRKGLDYLLRAFVKVKEHIPNVRLIVVGPGTRLRSKYEKFIKDMKLADVVCTDFVSSADMPAYYRSADIFCAPATGGESFGIVLLEAMASGKPVVASDIDGYSGLLAHGEDGLLVPPRDEDALAVALLTLLNDESLRYRMGTKGRAKAEEYSWVHVAQQVMDYYTSLIE